MRKRSLAFMPTTRPMRALLSALLAVVTACSAPQPMPTASRAVAAVGEGATRDEAMAAARRDAVRKVAGEFVKTRTEMVGERISEERVVSMSDGIVISTELLGEERLSDGTMRVRIVAQVADERMQEPGTGVRAEAVMKDRSSEAASRAERERESARMLEFVLEESDYPLGMFDATPTRPELLEQSGAMRLVWTTTLHADPLRWRRFLNESGRALAALGAADSIVPWLPRPAGRRLRDLTNMPPVVGRCFGRPLELRLTDASAPFLPGPSDNTVAPAEPDARDRTVLFVESSEVAARSFTLQRRGFRTLVGRLSRAATDRPVLHTRFLDTDGNELASAVATLDMNFSTCVMLLAQLRDGVPAAIPAGSGVVADGRPMTELRPMMLVPAIGIRGVLLREVALDFSVQIDDEIADRIERIECSLAWE